MGNKKYKDEHKKLGLCRDCSKPVIDFSLYCLDHYLAKKNRDRKYNSSHRRERVLASRERRKQWYRDNRCTSCSAPLMDEDVEAGYSSCVNCRVRTTSPTRLLGNLTYGAISKQTREGFKCDL